VYARAGIGTSEETDEKVLPKTAKEKIKQIICMIFTHFGLSTISEKELTSLLVKVYIDAGEIFDTSDALIWGEGFMFPEDICTRDELRLEKAGGNLSTMVGRLHQEVRHRRFSAARVKEMISCKHEDYRTLLDLAAGIVVGTCHEFRANGDITMPLREKYLAVAPAVNRMLMESWESEKVFIIHTKVARGIKGIHFSPASWAKKRGKPQGRPIVDASNATSGMSLNDPLEVAKGMAKDRYGEIALPTLKAISLMILKAAKRWGWEHLVLWKMDLAGAFTLLDIHPTDDRVVLFRTSKFSSRV
jgi:hypothetical protein